MQNNYWCSQCQWQNSCAAAQGYYPPAYDDNYRFDEENYEQTEDSYQEVEDYDYERSPRDVDRVIGLINRRSAAEIAEITRMGLDRRILDYFIRTMVTYLDRNFNRYTGPMQNRITQATRDIRRSFPWIFDIMRLYGISPATQARLLDEVVRTSLRDLRITPPTPPRPPVQPPRPPVQREEE